jgi:hypothetical protein
MNVKVSAANTAGLDLDLLGPEIGQSLAILQHSKLIDGFILERHSLGVLALEPRQSCAFWAPSTAEHAWSWGWR